MNPYIRNSVGNINFSLVQISFIAFEGIEASDDYARLLCKRVCDVHYPGTSWVSDSSRLSGYPGMQNTVACTS